jgi:DnaK suppressor protein
MSRKADKTSKGGKMFKKTKQMLLKLRDQVIEEIAERRKMESSDLKNEIGDFYDSADEERDRQLSHLLSDREREKLFEIDEALQRIEEGTYELCEECGKKIGENRLKIMPFARLCVPCQSEHEKKSEKRKYEEEGFYRDLNFPEFFDENEE